MNKVIITRGHLTPRTVVKREGLSSLDGGREGRVVAGRVVVVNDVAATRLTTNCLLIILS